MMNDIPEDLTVDYDQSTPELIAEVVPGEPDNKRRRKKSTAPHMEKSRKEWYQEVQRLKGKGGYFSEQQCAAVGDAMLSVTQQATGLPMDRTHKEGRDGLARSMAMAANEYGPGIPNRWMPLIMVSISFGSLMAEAYFIKRKEEGPKPKKVKVPAQEKPEDVYIDADGEVTFTAPTPFSLDKELNG